MNIRYLVSASAFAFMATISARAADIVIPDSNVSPEAFRWNGFYAGASTGVGWGWIPGINHKKTFSSDSGNDMQLITPRGYTGGLYAGTNFLAGDRLVLGAETDLNLSTINGESVGSRFDALDGQTTEIDIRYKWTGATRVRAGIASGRFLPYLSAGFAYGGIDRDVKISVTRWNINDTAHSSLIRTGWTAGAGFDYAVTDKVLLRAEYRYTDLGKELFHDVHIKQNYTLKYRTNDFRVGVAYKF